MRQQKLFGGFTKAVEDGTTDGVAILTAQRERMSAPTITLEEREVTKQILGFLESRGWQAHRNQVGEFIGLSDATAFLTALLDAAKKQGLPGVRAIAMQAIERWSKTRRQGGVKIEMGKAGIPDWLFTHPHFHPPIYVEMKATGKRPTPQQESYLAALRRIGYRAEWFDDLRTFVNWYDGEIVKGSDSPRAASAERSA